MTKLKLTYFDAPVSRGEECRLALHVAGVPFDDERVPQADWPARKPHAPFGSLPTLEVPGKGVLAQTNAILAFIGKGHGLLPTDAFEAARHEAIMEHVEDLRHAIRPSMRATDPAEKARLRETLATETVPTWGAQTERQISSAPFLGGEHISVADIKLYVLVRWLRSGVLDGIPRTVLDGQPRLLRLCAAVSEHPGVRSWEKR